MILICGGAGYIGSGTLKKTEKRRYVKKREE